MRSRSEQIPVWVSVFLMATASAFVMFGYEFVRSSANTLVKERYGSLGMAWSLAVMPFSLLSFLALYNYGLSRIGAKRTLIASYAVSALLIVISLLTLDSWGVLLIFMVREAYIVILVEQFWSFINSVANSEQSRRWNGPIIGVSSLGSIFGAWVLSISVGYFGTPMMIFLGCFTLIPAALITILAYRCSAGHDERLQVTSQQEKTPLGLGELWNSPLLKIIFIMVVLSQILATGLELDFQKSLQEYYPTRDEQTARSGQIFTIINSAACVLQFLIVPLLMHRLPQWILHLILPAFNIIMCIQAYVNRDGQGVLWSYICFKSLDYSLFRAAKELLYVPLDFNVRFRAKEFIDVFGYRVSKGVTSAVIAVFHGNLIGQSITLISIGAAGLWLLCIPFLRRTQSVEPTIDSK